MAVATHPRRRPARSNDFSLTPSLIDSFQNMSLRKGDTYHPAISTRKRNELWDPLQESPSMPVRSTTCPKALEDLLIGAGERRAAELLQRVDKAIETNSKLALSSVLNEPEVLPVPTFMVNDIDVRPRLHRHRHSSDSGIGSSVADSDDAKLTESDTITAIDAATEERGLSQYAADQIHEHIVAPILKEESLKEFHPLIEKVPVRISNKDIKTLRDLEKTLIFLAPDYALSPSKYLSFCERTIRVLHTTATTLHESDQRVPTDRPYTQGYFFDLVEQIRRYAQILAATREREHQNAEKSDEMDFTKGETVSLHGGMSHNGKAPELVRHTKNGKAISLATGLPLSPEELSASSMKRPMPADLIDDEEALRSMARRKKGAKPEIHECHLCDKEFKRNCDLTKHIKTHERPWKCPEEKCKYHEHGWPTEKERDRHVNDKHSSEPPLYHCLFEGCPYTSKRESNCKQHMEKAHGWEYVRSKSNGKGRASGSTSSSNVMRLPRGSVPPSPAASLLTPLTPILPSPSTHSYASSSCGSMPPPGVAGPSNYGTPAFTHPSPDFTGHFNMNFNFNDLTTGWPTPAMSDERRTSTTASSHSGLQLDGSSFDEMSPHELNMETMDTYNFGNFTFDDMPNKTYMPDSGFGSAALHTSPGAQLDQTFSTAPNDFMNVDGAFGDFTTAPTEDFTLFGNSAAPTTGAMMSSLPAEGSSWGNFGGHFDINATTSQLLADNSELGELFPELKH